MLDATSFLRLTVLRYRGALSDLDRLWESQVRPRIEGSDVAIFDLACARNDDAAALARTLARCAAELPFTHVRVALDAHVSPPGKLPGVIWEDVDLTPELVAV